MAREVRIAYQNPTGTITAKVINAATGAVAATVTLAKDSGTDVYAGNFSPTAGTLYDVVFYDDSDIIGASQLPDPTVAAIATATALAVDGVSGVGSVSVNHNYGGEDELQIVDAGDVPVASATLTAYEATAYNAGTRDIVAQVQTGTDGRWAEDMSLDPGEYVITVTKSGMASKSFTLEVA